MINDFAAPEKCGVLIAGHNGYGTTAHLEDHTLHRASAPKRPFLTLSQRRHINIIAIILMLLIPFVTFTLVCASFSFSLNFFHPWLPFLVLVAGLLVSLAFYLLGHANHLHNKAGLSSDPAWFNFIAMLTLLACVCGFGLGEYNYSSNMQSFYQLSNLQTYGGVDPSRNRGQQMLDAGRLVFASGVHLDLNHSMSFVDGHSYCVAPVSIEFDGAMQQLALYDFWAAGVDCCEKEFLCSNRLDNADALAGYRISNHDARVEYYHLAVKQAESTFGIKASQPIFFHWAKDPVAELDDQQESGVRFFSRSIFWGFIVLALIVAALVWFRCYIMAYV